ncbi:MAG: ABC transporter ATP-binding protein [Butyricicoccus sp.]
MSHPFVETKEMTVGYRGVPLIRDIALRVHRGEILTLIGPNGSGKSTILKSLIRQLALIGGTVYLDGKSLQTLPERDLARTMSVLLTEHVRPELMTCWDVAAAGRYPYTGRLGLLSDEDRAKVDEALALVGADELADRDFSCISDGQRQRVLLARAICQEPEVIVLDEPTSFLDIRYKLELLTVLKQLVREKQVAVILSLHEIDLAQKLSDRLICVHTAELSAAARRSRYSPATTSAPCMTSSAALREQFGSLEPERVTGEPRVFVIGGGGSGTALYRRLRRGIPFAAGILPENDVSCRRLVLWRSRPSPSGRTSRSVRTLTRVRRRLYGSAEMRSAVWVCSVRSTKKTACCATGHSRRGCCGANQSWKILHDDRLKCCSKRNVVVK